MTTRANNAIPGRDILRAAHEQYEPYRAAIAALHKSVVIIRVQAAADAPLDWRVRSDASRTSARRKIINFALIGLNPVEHVLEHDVNDGHFAELIQTANADPTVMAIIVQQPVHARLQDFVQDIDPAKDIDALTSSSLHEVCATPEGIWRVAEPFTHDDPAIAVVGAEGFVGRGVVKRLQQHDLTVTPFTEGSDLTRLPDADIVISVTGTPDLLTRDHLRPHHRLVVDCGFYPTPSGIRSDVRADAVAIPQNITLVPGGIGPVEMAVLIERAVRTTIDPSVPPWPYDGESFKPRSRYALSGPAAAAAHAALGFPGPTRPAGTTAQPGTRAQPPPRLPERGNER
jgi:methylenetetrahydrofolate dehydrogenase (NADP+)/methenyltetrahydrofolate cyclohydrolase